MQEQPSATLSDLQEYCEEIIPPQLYPANRWLVQQTLDWYTYILAQRKANQGRLEDNDFDET